MIIEKMNIKMKKQEELIKQLHSKLLQIQNNQKDIYFLINRHSCIKLDNQCDYILQYF